MKIAHIADIQIRFGTRHDEYRDVFKNLYEDLCNQNVDRIVIAGDLCHHKIQISPNSLDVTAEFLINLSKIAPVDIIAGNHDLNLRHIEQGDTIKSIINIIQNGIIVEKESDINFNENYIYYFRESGFYDLKNGIIYGISSMIDGNITTLDYDKKDPSKTYIAIYHGTIFGSVMDNLYKIKKDEYVKIDAFENYDIIMLGDIHEYQTFDIWEKKEVSLSELDDYLTEEWETYE